MGAQNQILIDTAKLRERYREAYLNKYKDLLFNAVEFTGADLPKDAPANYLITKFFEDGKIGFARDTKLWLPATYSGYINAYGLNDKIQLTGLNGAVLTLNNNKDGFMVRFTPSGTGLKEWFDLMIDDIVDLRLAIKAYSICYQTPLIVEVDDNANKLSLKNAFLQRQIGLPVIFASSATKRILDNAITKQPEFIIDKLKEACDAIERDILIRFGIVSGNQSKKERVQNAELPVEYAIDSVYTFIDTFNKDCKTHKINAQARLNGAVEEIYNNQQNAFKNEINAI